MKASLDRIPGFAPLMMMIHVRTAEEKIVKLWNIEFEFLRLVLD